MFGAATFLMLTMQTATVPASPATSPAEEERRICRRSVDTGSLARRIRECRTKAEWDRIAEAARANGQDIVARGAGGLNLSGQ